MANLPITVRVTTPLPVSVRDLPKFEKAVQAMAGTLGIKSADVLFDFDAAATGQYSVTFEGKLR